MDCDGTVSAWTAGIAAAQQAGLPRWDQATLLTRVWDVDALQGEGCGGRMRFIAVIKDRAVIERILRHIGEDAEEPAVREGARSMRRVDVKGAAGARRRRRA